MMRTRNGIHTNLERAIPDPIVGMAEMTPNASRKKEKRGEQIRKSMKKYHIKPSLEPGQMPCMQKIKVCSMDRCYHSKYCEAYIARNQK